jgi:hypothetical protein
LSSKDLLTFVHPATLGCHPLMVGPPILHERLTNVLAQHARFGDQFIELEIQDLKLIRRKKTR